MLLSASFSIRLASVLRRGERANGQVAVIFVALIALIIALAAFTMNLGEVARLKTSTANAADAGALAAASWIASGENEVAKIAQGMWINVYLVQAVFLLPFCMQVCIWAIILMGVLAFVNGVILRQIANDVLDSTWDLAHADAFFVGVQNLLIDDESGGVSKRLEQMGAEFQANQQLPPPSTCPPGTLPGSQCLEWQRPNPSGGSPRKPWVAIHTNFSNSKPDLTMGNWGPWALCLLWWPTCSSNGGGCCLNTPWGCVWPCFRMPRAWVRWGGKKKGGQSSTGQATMSAGQKMWSMASSGLMGMVGFLPNPIKDTGECGFCLPIPLNIPKLPAEPHGVHNGTGDVTVTVMYHREGGAVKGGSGVSFWTTHYPNIITSDATAHYTEASMGSFGSLPQSRAVADLTRTR